MSTATIDRPLRAVNASNRMRISEGIDAKRRLAVVRDVAKWAPSKALRLVKDAARFTHLDRLYFWAAGVAGKVIGVAGYRTSATYAVTSKTGQRFIGWAARTVARTAWWTLRVAWKTVTWPLTLLPPTNRLVVGIETVANKAVMSPPSIIAMGVVLTAADGVSYAVSADRPWIQAINTIAFVIAAVRLTRRFAPPGIIRLLTYAVEIPVVLARLQPFGDKMLGHVKWGEAVSKAVDGTVEMTADIAKAEADQLDLEALRLEEKQTELRKTNATEALAMQEQIDRTHAQAAEMRQKAETLAETAADLIEEETIVDVPAPVVSETVLATVAPPTDPANGNGPSVPPMGGLRPPGPQGSQPQPAKSKAQKRREAEERAKQQGAQQRP